MPIGKNAIKRVSTGTSAQVNAQAVEVVVTEPKAEETVAPKVEKMPKAAKASAAEAPIEAAPKKTAPKKSAPKKSMEKEPDFSPVNTAKKVTKKPTKNEKTEEKSYINIGGGDLPYYLL